MESFVFASACSPEWNFFPFKMCTMKFFTIKDSRSQKIVRRLHDAKWVNVASIRWMHFPTAKGNKKKSYLLSKNEAMFFAAHSNWISKNQASRNCGVSYHELLVTEDVRRLEIRLCNNFIQSIFLLITQQIAFIWLYICSFISPLRMSVLLTVKLYKSHELAKQDTTQPLQYIIQKEALHANEK